MHDASSRSPLRCFEHFQQPLVTVSGHRFSLKLPGSAHLLCSLRGDRGVLLAGSCGVIPCEVVIRALVSISQVEKIRPESSPTSAMNEQGTLP